ncbi:MAG: phage tail fiber protein [Burkholderiaceae bacterium]
MAAKTDFLENKQIDFLFRGQALGIGDSTAGAGSGPTQLFVGLLTAAPGEAGGGTEVSGGSYARVSVPSSLANWAGTQGAGTTTASSGSSGQTSNNGTITFPAPTAAWGVVTHFAIFDAASGGNMLIYGALAANKTINSGDSAPSFAAAQLTYQEDN